MAEKDRREFLRQPFLLPADVLVFPVTELAEHVRDALEFEKGDYAVTRPNMRSFSRIVNFETAALLEEFRKPTTITEAIIRYGQKNGLDPLELLESSFPILQTFSTAAFLVPADSPLAEGVAASYASGQIFADYEIRRLIQVLEDTEIYQAIDQDGQILALKISRPHPNFTLLLAITREAEVLKYLDGQCSPTLIEQGAYNDRVFLATKWLSGIPVNQRAHELRNGSLPTWRQEIHQLCCRLLNVYCVLHEHGIIHGDIHSQNALVDGNDTITILDFGLARLPSRSDLEHNQRSGMAWFMDPELARAILNKDPLPPASFLGEQYSLAALIYHLICGAHYLAATPEYEILYRQILNTRPPPFTRYGFESWPEVEPVLARALSKTPHDRYDSMADFRDAFSQVQPPSIKASVLSEIALNSQRQRWIETIIAHTSFNPNADKLLFPQSPTASIYFGAAGLVWFLYRSAQIQEDSSLLASADLWARHLLNYIERPGSFGTPLQKEDEAQEQFASLYLGRSGLHFVSALVSHARGDISSCIEQTQKFITTSKMQNDNPELLFGKCGLLVGGSMLLEAFTWSGRLDTTSLKNFLHEVCAELITEVKNKPDTLDQSALPHLGIAHGWAGILFALLTAYRILHVSPPPIIKERLQQLADKAEPHGRGVSWLGTLLHPDQVSQMPSYAPGWCSGSGGHVYLWTLATELYFDDQYEVLANKASWYTWEHPDSNTNLCCGLTGRAFALLRYYRFTGDRKWLVRAEELAKRALAPFIDNFIVDERTFSLYRGALGPTLLAIELESPESSAMPVFDMEGWPSSSITTL